MKRLLLISQCLEYTVYVNVIFVLFAHDSAIKVAFNRFSKTWKFREDPNSQKLSWRSWRGKKSRYLAEEFIPIRDFFAVRTHWMKFHGHFNSWNTETELQREGRSMVSLNLLHRRRSSINRQPRRCKCNSLISLKAICDISEVYPCDADHRCYVFLTFLTSLVTHLQQKLWTAHQRRPNKW